MSKKADSKYANQSNAAVPMGGWVKAFVVKAMVMMVVLMDIV